jgi:hypothetical protein
VIASKAVWLGEVEARGRRHGESRRGNKVPASSQANGNTTMTRRKGEITRSDLKRKWRHQVAPRNTLPWRRQFVGSRKFHGNEHDRTSF